MSQPYAVTGWKEQQKILSALSQGYKWVTVYNQCFSANWKCFSPSELKLQRKIKVKRVSDGRTVDSVQAAAVSLFFHEYLKMQLHVYVKDFTPIKPSEGIKTLEFNYLDDCFCFLKMSLGCSKKNLHNARFYFFLILTTLSDFLQQSVAAAFHDLCWNLIRNVIISHFAFHALWIL